MRRARPGTKDAWRAGLTRLRALALCCIRCSRAAALGHEHVREPLGLVREVKDRASRRVAKWGSPKWGMGTDFTCPRAAAPFRNAPGFANAPGLATSGFATPGRAPCERTAGQPLAKLILVV